MFLIISPP